MPAPQYAVGDIVPYYLSAGLVVGSFFVSLVGTISAIELLHRRSVWQGWRSNVYLFACAISMGLTAIWCMHYIGNAAITMGDGSAEYQLQYNLRYTIISAFLPVVAFFVAFNVTSIQYRGKAWLVMSVGASGLLSGLAIFGMHYTANLGVFNYSISYNSATVGAAVVIATVSSVFALTLFFILRQMWIAHWFYRLICAIVLATAVSGMHFEASMGTEYHLKAVSHQGGISRNANVIIATVLCLLTVPMCSILVFYSARRLRQTTHKAQTIVLASVTFDFHGRLMVTEEGFLPSREITGMHNDMGLENVLTGTHPTFNWMFRASHNWATVVDFIPAMRRHLKLIKSETEKHKYAPERELAGRNDMCDLSIFREAFCVAAADLALDMNQTIEQLGSLYEGFLTTGIPTGYPRSTRSYHQTILKAFRLKRSSEDEESCTGDSDPYGKGQMLVLVRQVSKSEASHMVSAGYRFADLERVQDILAQTLQVPARYLINQMSIIRDYTQRDVGPPHRGTYLACFVLRTKLVRGGWEVAVREDNPHMLPHVHLLDRRINESEGKLLSKLEGRSVEKCLQWLTEIPDSTNEELRHFLNHLGEQLRSLRQEVNESFFNNAIFCSRPVRMPDFQLQNTDRIESDLLVLHIIPDVHSSNLKSNSPYIYTPLNLFRSRIQVLPGAPDHILFARQVHQEFAPQFMPLVPQMTAQPVNSFRGTAAKIRKQTSSPWISIRESRQQSSDKPGEIEVHECTARANNSLSQEGLTPKGSTEASIEILTTSEHTQAGDSMVTPGPTMPLGHVHVQGSGFVDELYTMAVQRWYCPPAREV